MRRHGWIALIALIVLSVSPSGSASAEERTCRRTIGAITVDNLRVPQGAECILNGTFVEGTVKVEARATLRALHIRVIGNVQTENAQRVVLRGGSRVGGSVQIVQGGSARVLNSRINGDILFDEQDRNLVADRNVVGGNLQVFQNTGGVEIRRNRIDGNLQCKANRPRPIGGGNLVQGNREDQCQRL